MVVENGNTTAYTNHVSACLCGKFLAGDTWASPGVGVLWLEDKEKRTEELIRWVETAIGPLEDNIRKLRPKFQTQKLSGEGYIYLSEEQFFDVLEQLSLRGVGTGDQSADNPSFQSISTELAIYCHIQKLAASLVDKGDIVAFAAPEKATWPDVLAACFTLTTAGEETLGYWSSKVGTYVASWAPTWGYPEHRALRMLWVSMANEHFQPLVKLKQWGNERIGQSLVELWVWRCIQVFMQRYGQAQSPQEESSSGQYRIPYRGEEEVISGWEAALNGESSAVSNIEGGHRSFFGDGWLVWRTLRQHFTDSGWRKEWLFDESGRANYHLELELATPPESNPQADWRLVFYVAHNLWDRKAPLSDWWLQADRKWKIGNEVLVGPDEWILPKLREVGQVVPAVQTALAYPATGECVLSPDDVFPFLTEHLVQLEALGVPVRCPDVFAENATDVRLRIHVKKAKSKTTAKSSRRVVDEAWFSAEHLVDFDWTIVLGENELSRDEFEQMVSARSPFVNIGGSWRLIPLKEILEQVEQLRAGKPSTSSQNALQLLRGILLNQGTEGDDVPVEIEFEETASEAQMFFTAMLEADKPALLSTPEGFHGTLRDYQRFGFSWMAHLRTVGCGAVLADDMGLGKTIQVLSYLQWLKETGAARAPHLLICPTSLVQNWKLEVTRFTPDLRVYVHHGAQRNVSVEGEERPLERALQEADIVMTTYATVVRDVDLLKEFAWDVVIADEAQNIKNQDTKQAQAVCSLVAFQRIALTGTPVENRLEELWSIFQFANPGYLGGGNWFRRTFVIPLSSGSAKSAARLHQLLKPVLLRRTKTNPAIQLELPEKWEYTQYAALSTEQAALYQSVVNQLFSDLPSSKGMTRRGQILAALVRLKQLCDHPCILVGGSGDAERSGKMKLLLDLLETVISEGESALIFTQFRDMGSLLCNALETHFGWRAQFLHGGLSAAERGSIVENFQSGKDTSPVLVLSLKAGGVGLNLTRANHVFHFDRWWNPAVEDQATDRVFRIGQTKDVQVHKLVCPGTLEERIDELIHSKRKLSSSVVGNSESWITELDDKALQGLFALDVKTALEDEVWLDEKETL